MALPVEVAEFYSIIVGFWMLLPLVIRQVFYFAFFVVAVIAVLEFWRGRSDD